LQQFVPLVKSMDDDLHLLKYLLIVCQPDHILDDANSAGKKIGIERAERSSYSFRSLLDGGAHLAFGSDWPVCVS
jgi:predicted amidohydrolase YtcJ